MRNGVPILLCALLSLCSAVPCAFSQVTSMRVVLDTTGIWRMYSVFKPQVVGTVPVPCEANWQEWESPEPPADWTRPDFDDHRWLRGPASASPKTSRLSRLCLRGRFMVKSPSGARNLAVTVGYHGGVIVYLNGEEIARRHVKKRATRGRADLAEGYPEEVFVTSEGKYLAPKGAYLSAGPSKSITQDSLERMKRRPRYLEKVALPGRRLRRGENVLAVEIVRAPYHEVFKGMKGRAFPHEFTWNTCQLLSVQMTGSGAGENASRPGGLQLWNADPMTGDLDIDFGCQVEALRPIELVGARGGVYSGKVILGSTKPIRGLKVTVGGLKGRGGAIPSSNVRVRYGIPWGSEHVTAQTYHRQPYPYAAVPTLLGALSHVPPKEFPVRPIRKGRETVKTPYEPVPGAVVPIWVTVKVPKKIRAGTYTGEVAIRMQGERPLRASVQMKVMDWTLPDPQDFKTWVDMIQSPDTLMVEYGLDRWSERHWRMIAKSFSLLNEVGSRTVYIPLIAHTNIGNEESMVRWIRKGPGRYGHDFSIMDRYLDTAEEHMGRPKALIFVVWDLYMIPKSDNLADAEAKRAGKRKRHTRMATNIAKKGGKLGLGPLVTVVDPATKKTENVYLPTHFESSSRALWKPLFTELRSRLKKRGLEKTMMLGIHTDAWVSKKEVELFNELSGDAPWVMQSHDGFSEGKLMYGISRVAYQTRVWSVLFSDDQVRHGKNAGGRTLSGWKREELVVVFERNPGLDAYPSCRWRHFAETCITGLERGCGRLGADFWKAVKDKRGRRRGRVQERFPESHWRNLNLTTALLAPGPDGPVSTIRFEMFREGVQECEARIVIERALTDEGLRRRLGGALAKQCEEALEERHMYMWNGMSSQQYCGPGWANAYGWRWTPGVAGQKWFIGSGWQARTEKLYTLAARVERKTGRPGK